MGKTYHDSWAAWGEFRKLRSLTKEQEDWKREALEEREVPVQQVFVIINEWTDIAGDTSSEVVGAKWFESEDAAWQALDLIAESYSYDLDGEETSIQLSDHNSSLQSEEYRIEELTRG